MTDEYVHRPSRDDYLAACHAWADDRISAWTELWELLSDRPGWHVEVDGQGPMWRFGVAGAARLVVTIDNEHFVVFEFQADETKHLLDIQSVLWWIQQREPANEGLTNLQEEIVEEVLPMEADEWLRTQDKNDN